MERFTGGVLKAAKIKDAPDDITRGICFSISKVKM